jgi:hypothetical protein
MPGGPCAFGASPSWFGKTAFATPRLRSTIGSLTDLVVGLLPSIEAAWNDREQVQMRLASKS